MSEPTFNLFGPISKADIKVGYISTERGYVQGVTICSANTHAKKNPGEVFIYKPTRNEVRFLNINEVNRLGEDPGLAQLERSCPIYIPKSAGKFGKEHLIPTKTSMKTCALFWIKRHCSQ